MESHMRKPEYWRGLWRESLSQVCDKYPLDTLPPKEKFSKIASVIFNLVLGNPGWVPYTWRGIDRELTSYKSITFGDVIFISFYSDADIVTISYLYGDKEDPLAVKWKPTTP